MTAITKSVLPASVVTFSALRSCCEARRLLQQSAERRRLEQVAAPPGALAELELREDRGGFRRPGGLALLPQPAEPVAQLAVTRLAVEDPLDHELGRNRSVPAVLLQPEGDVEAGLLAEAVELAAESKGDRAARVTGTVFDPKAQMLAVPDG